MRTPVPTLPSRAHPQDYGRRTTPTNDDDDDDDDKDDDDDDDGTVSGRFWGPRGEKIMKENIGFVQNLR